MRKFIYLIFILKILLINECVSASEDLYNVLGVRRTASQKEIKQAYKRLAREWHPDKSKDENAADVFTKINEAYETLGDQDKRLQYDKFGYTSAREPQKPQGYPGFRSAFEGFDNFFKSGGFNFNFGGESFIDKYTINKRVYNTKIFPESYQKPCLLYAYTDFCFECSRIEYHLEKFIKELESVGIAVGTFHAGRAQELSQSLKIYRVPAIVGLVSGKTTFFTSHVNTQNLRNFARGLFPSKTLQKITDETYQSFLEGTSDNHMRAMLMGPKEEPTARFLAPAFYFKEFVKFAYVQTHSPFAEKLVKKFGINKHRETLLMFNEEMSSPVATISMQQLPRSTLDEVIEGNKFLQLPRLSSQLRFDELCPIERLARRKRLCVVLFTKKKVDEHEAYRDTFRKYVHRFPIVYQDRVRFTYIYEEAQKGFVKTLKDSGDSSMTTDSDSLKVLLIWRMERHQTSYEWLETGWSNDPNRLKECEEHLEQKVKLLLNSDQSLAFRAILPDLDNEHALGLMIRILYRLWDWGERLYGYTTGYDVISMSTILLSLFFMFGMGYFMHKMAVIEDEQIKKSKPRKTKPRPPSTSVDKRKINLYEMNDKSYDDLVLNAETGLTFTLLVDEESKENLLKTFGELVYPYTRYSALTFAFVSLDFYIGWFRHVLEESVDSKVTLSNIRIRNCVGTVLAMNGFRKYYYIYQPRKARKWMRQRNMVTSAIGFCESDEDSDDEGAIPVDELLTGLTNWMDRVFDGSVRKIRVPNWPEMTIK